MDIPVYLINLDRSHDRLAFMQEQADRLGIRMQRVPGVDGTANLPSSLAHQFPPTKMTSSEVGCYASHLSAMRKVMDEGHEFAIILEDDATLDPRFMSIASAAIEAAPRKWDIIHLCTQYKRSPWYPIAELGGHTLVRYSRLPVNMAAYAISHGGCRKYLEERPRIRPVDMELRYPWLSGLDICGVYSAPAMQLDNFNSTIGDRLIARHSWSPSPLSQAYGILYVKWMLGLSGTLWCWNMTIINSLRKRLTLRKKRFSAFEAAPR